MSLFAPKYICIEIEQLSENIPEHLAIYTESGELKLVRSMESYTPAFIWQQVTDWLRELNVHVSVFPGTEAQLEYSYNIHTHLGEEWSNENWFPGYYEALEDAVRESMNVIRQSMMLQEGIL